MKIENCKLEILNKDSLIQNLISSGHLKTPRVIEAFKKIDRADFVPESLKDEAYVNAPLPIGEGQTISQPLTVAFMLELLEPKQGEKILDIGFGSGWTTALLAEIVFSSFVIPSPPAGGRRISSVRSFGLRPQDDNKERGKVCAIERVPELCEFGKNNVAKYFSIKDYPLTRSARSGSNEARVEMKCGDGTKGWIEKAPFDKILAGASAREMPKAWKEQLKIGGRIVAPVEHSVWLVIKKSEKEFEEIEYPGFVFVPLISG